MAVGTTKSAVAAVYSATVTPSETTTLVVGDGTTTVSVASATYSNIDEQVAIQSANNYGNLLFTVAKNIAGDAIEFTYKTAGSVASTPTFTGSGSTHTITNPTVGECRDTCYWSRCSLQCDSDASETTALTAVMAQIQLLWQVQLIIVSLIK